MRTRVAAERVAGCWLTVGCMFPAAFPEWSKTRILTGITGTRTRHHVGAIRLAIAACARRDGELYFLADQHIA